VKRTNCRSPRLIAWRPRGSTCPISPAATGPRHSASRDVSLRLRRHARRTYTFVRASQQTKDFRNEIAWSLPQGIEGVKNYGMVKPDRPLPQRADGPAGVRHARVLAVVAKSLLIYIEWFLMRRGWSAAHFAGTMEALRYPLVPTLRVGMRGAAF
jgi:hypothetical protein